MIIYGGYIEVGGNDSVVCVCIILQEYYTHYVASIHIHVHTCIVIIS